MTGIDGNEILECYGILAVFESVCMDGVIFPYRNIVLHELSSGL
jgi:hypothetical protein